MMWKQLNHDQHYHHHAAVSIAIMKQKLNYHNHHRHHHQWSLWITVVQMQHHHQLCDFITKKYIHIKTMLIINLLLKMSATKIKITWDCSQTRANVIAWIMHSKIVLWISSIVSVWIPLCVLFSSCFVFVFKFSTW